MTDELPGFGVDFVIDAGDSYAQLAQLDALMKSTEAKILQQAIQIEQATKGMIDVADSSANMRQLANATAKATADMKRDFGQVGAAKEALDRALGRTTVSTSGPAASGEQAKLTREINATEKAIDRLIATMDRETAAMGRTREERRAAMVEELAQTAAQQGNADAADRIRASYQAQTAAREAQAQAAAAAAQASAAAIEVEAQALRSAATAHQMFEAAARRGMQVYRDEQREAAAAAQAQQELARAAERLRGQLDPSYAAQQRFNQGVGEARALVGANLISLDEYCAALRREEQALKLSNSAQEEAVQKTRAHGGAMAAIGPQAQDTFTQLSMGANVFSVLAIQGGQAAGQMQHLEGRIGAVASFMMGPWGLAITAGLMVLGALTNGLFDNEEASKKAEDGMKKFQDRQSDIGNFIDATTGKLVEQNRTLVLNAILTRKAQIADNDKAMAEQRNTAFRVAGNQQTRNPSYAPNSVGATVAMRETDPDVQRAIQAAGGNVGKLASSLAKLAATRRPDLKDLALQITTQAGAAILATRENEKLGRELRALGGDTTALAGSSTALIDKQVALATATTPLEKARAQLAIVQQGATAADKAGGAALVKYRQDLTAATNAVNDAQEAQKAAAAARREGTKEANRAAAEARKDANHAAELQREADAVEAQIVNLYKLADAYGAVGGEALIAEARVKAESRAIKTQADTDAAVDRQIRLLIAQRVSDAARATAGMRNQADAQKAANDAVAAGLIPAEKAAEMVQDQLADLPLLAAQQVAQQRGLKAAAEEATNALAAQRSERERVRKESQTTQLNTDLAAGGNRIAELQMELQLVGATDAARTRSLAILRATQEARTKFEDPVAQQRYIAQQVEIADRTAQIAQAQRDWNDALTFTADKWDLVARNVQQAAQGMADAFGNVGRAIGDVAGIYSDYAARRERADQAHRTAIANSGSEAERERIDAKYALETATSRVGVYGDMAKAAKGFFGENTAGYQAMATAEKAFRAVEFALSVKSMAQDAIETGSSIAKSGARTAAHAVEAVVKAISSLPFPLNIVAGAATIAALAGIGVSIVGSLTGGGKKTVEPANTGTGTVLGDSTAKSDSIKNAIDALKEVDTLTNSYARQMAASLKTIESQIGNVASLVVRSGVNDSKSTVTEGFKPNAIGSLLGNIPLIGGFLSSLFGSKTTVLGNGLYGGAQSLGSILSGGFNASSYTDVEKVSKFLGITTSKKTSTQYSAIDPSLGNQFTLILRSFSEAIGAAAAPLGQSTQEIQNRLNGFVVNIGKIDLKGLTGEQIQEKLNAVFGAAADSMASAAFPGIERFQKVGEGAFETLVRVSSSVEAVTTALDQLGASSRSLGIDAKLGLADQFDSISALTSAIDGYFSAFYTKEEQAAAKGAQLSKVFDSLGVSMPTSLAAFRQLVEAQDLTTAAGQATYATLLKLAPAFADLKAAMDGAKSAADILSEREGLQRQLLELNGDTAAIRALDLAKLDASNRALQEQIYAIQDAKDAAKAADELRQAWTSVGDSIMDEVKRIRGLTDASGGNTFATLLGQFNAANEAARAGDQDAAKSLPALSQALLGKAADVATSRQELARIQAQTAAALEATYGVIGALTSKKATSTTEQVTAAAESQGTASPAAANDDVVSEIKSLREEVSLLRSENNSGNAQIANGTTKTAKILDNVTSASGGTAIAVGNA